MTEVHSTDHLARIDEKRREEKTEEEKRTSQAAFEQRLQQGKAQKQQAAQKQQQTRGSQQADHASQTQKSQQEQAAEQAKGQQQAGKTAKKGAKEATQKQQGSVLDHVRNQNQQQNARAMDRARAGMLGLAGQQAKEEADRAASSSQEGARTLTSKGEESTTTKKTDEKRATSETREKDKVKESEKEEVKNEKTQEARSQAQAQDVRAQRDVQNQQQVDADGRRQQQGQSGSQGGQQQQRAQDAPDVKGPSAQSIRRAAKADEIQKLCEKLLDNFFMGCAPDGSAMMRMELKEGVLAGLVIDLNVDDKRNVKLTLSGGNKEAIDFVTSSRGDLARALGRKGLNLASVETG